MAFTAPAGAADLQQAQPVGTAGAAATPAAEPAVADVIGKSLTAYGGRDALADLMNSASYFGKQSSPGSEGLAYRHVRKGVRWRTDVESNLAPHPVTPEKTDKDAASPATDQSVPGETKTITETEAFDGTTGWQAENEQVLDLPRDRLTYLNDQEQRQPWLIARWQDPDYEFALKGRTTYKQIPVFAVEVTQKDQRPTTLFIDQNNYMIVGIAYETEIPETDVASKGPAKMANVAVDYSEYRPNGGTLVPFKEVRSLNNAEVETLAFTKVTIGGSIEDSVFNKPGAGTAWHIPHSVTMPFDYSQKEVIVKGRVNGSEELDFLFDTGASETIIDRRVGAEHFLAKQGQYDIVGVAGYVATQTSIVKKLEIGNLTLNDVQVRILDLSGQSRALGKPIAGVIGTNIISKFVTVLDYAKPAITFGDNDNYQRPTKAASASFAQKEAPFVKVLLGGKDEQVLLVDTGAAFNHIPTNIAQKFLSNDPSNLRHVTEGTGLDGRPLQLGKVVIDPVSIGGMSVRKVAFTYPWRADMSKSGHDTAAGAHERGGFFQDSHLGILGNPFWENFIVTVDYKYQRLLLQSNPIVRIRGEIGQALATGDNALTLHRDYRSAELNYQRALILADSATDVKEQARLLGRLGNLRRIMAKDLQRPEHAKAAYAFFTRAQELAAKVHAPDVEGRVLADWSLLYSDNEQTDEAKVTIDRALLLAPQDPNVNVDCAVQLYRAHLYAEMQKYVEKALFLEPSNWQALWYQVKLSETFYDTPKVVATLKEILRFYPWSTVAKQKLKTLNITTPGGSSTSEGNSSSHASAPAATPRPAAPPAVQRTVAPR